MPLHYPRELGKFTTLKGRRVKFDVVEVRPSNMLLQGLRFGIKEVGGGTKTVWIWYADDWNHLFHREDDGRIKKESLAPIFEAIREFVFYERIEEEILEIVLGKENPLGLKLKETHGKYRVTYGGNEDYREHLYERMAYEICSVLRPKYGEYLHLEEIIKKVWFPPALIEKLLSNYEIKEASYWSILKSVSGSTKAIKLTDKGREFVKNYKSPLDTPEAEADLELEAVKSTIFTAPDFSFVTDDRMKGILKRDWIEIQKNLRVEVKNWKSAIVLCGGVLEGLLFDSLLQQETTAKASKRKLRSSDNRITKSNSIKDWSLHTLIEVATDLGLISPTAQLHGSVIKVFRNLIHPYEELEGGYDVGSHEAIAGFEVLQRVVKNLEEKLGSSTS